MTPSVCPGNDITIRDEVLDGYQCKECQTCPAGQGLSVNCGDVITSQTPIKCLPCVLGETYSAGNQAGACKTCHTCDEYQETIKACALTSNAECGSCTQRAYFDNTVEKCKPCSPCCNDGKDILEAGCQVPGVAANMQCTFARSEKCSNVAVRNVSIGPSSTQHPTPSSTVGIRWPTTTSPTTKNLDEPSALSASAATSSYWIAGGVGVAVAFLVFFVFLAIFYYRRKRKYQERETALSAEEIERLEPGQSNETETNEQDPLTVVLLALEPSTSPVEEIFLPHASGYSISKFGVGTFSDALRRELSPSGLKVSVIEPGFFRTNITSKGNLREQWNTLWNELDGSLKEEYGGKYFQTSK